MRMAVRKHGFLVKRFELRSHDSNPQKRNGSDVNTDKYARINSSVQSLTTPCMKAGLEANA
jgi:hypothetical protein